MRNDFDGWVFDEAFVRAGHHEPPARTRAAITKLGGQRTSWRQPGEPVENSRHARSTRVGAPVRMLRRLLHRRPR